MKMLRLRLFVALAAAAILFAVPRVARAQHFDANVEAGPSKRFLSAGSLNGDFGAVAGIQAHIALIPLLRIGAYFDEEIAPTGEPSTRTITSGGLRLKVAPPLGSEKWHYWFFAGFGAASVSSPGYTVANYPIPNGSSLTNSTVVASKAGGGFLEIPFGVGTAYRFQKPWELLFELSGRVGFNMTGSFYDPTGRPAVSEGAAGNLGLGLGPAGNDTFGLFFTVGIGLDL